MKKLLVTLALFLFLVALSGMKTEAFAQDIQMNVNMSKDVSSTGETYGIRFSLSGDQLKKASRIFVDGPRGRRVWVNNTLNLNDILLSALNLGLDEFNLYFPEGDYKISFSPPAIGKLKVHMTHNFPSIPAITSPLDGAVNVPTNPVITWAPITGISGLQLQLTDNAGFVLGTSLPFNATSYAVPANLLKPNTGYELSLEARITDLINGTSELTTTMTISFTTGAQ